MLIVEPWSLLIKKIKVSSLPAAPARVSREGRKFETKK